MNRSTRTHGRRNEGPGEGVKPRPLHFSHQTLIHDKIGKLETGMKPVRLIPARATRAAPSVVPFTMAG